MSFWRFAIPLLLAILITPPALQAATAPPPAPAPVLKALKPAGVDFKRLIPPPPAAGSDTQKAELAEVRRVMAASTPDRIAAAEWDNDHEDASLYTATLGVDPNSLPKTKALLDIVINDQEIATDTAKAYFKRLRPWAVDTGIKPCSDVTSKNPASSYPSGHAGIGYSTGLILADLLPEKAQAILARASDYALSREVCGDHFPSDLEASHALANAVASELLLDPVLKAKLDAARIELRRAVLK